MLFQLQTIVAGNNISIRYQVLDQTKSPPVLMDPNGGVFLSLRKPDGTLVLDAMPMVKDKVGYYYHKWQSLDTDMAGPWQTRGKAVHDTEVNLSQWENAFILVAP